MSDQSVFPQWRSFLSSSSHENEFRIKKVVDSDGVTSDYERGRIEETIRDIYSSLKEGVDPQKVSSLTDQVESALASSTCGTASIAKSSEIQDIVETVLIKNNEALAAKSYIIGRERKDALRNTTNLFVDITKTMGGYLKQDDWRIHENANVNFSLGGLILHNSGTVTANYWLRNIYPKEIADAHRNCAIHIHDLSMFAPYCAGWSLRQLVKEGISGVSGKVSSKPACHLSTLCRQMTEFLGIMQNEWAGAQSFSSFDTYLAPFVRIDDLDYPEVFQCMQSFVFGINATSRWGGQSPFTNITLDWTCPSDLKDKKALACGVEQPFTYGELQREMDMINKAFLCVMLEGDAEGRGFPYPVPTYNITADFDWNAENADFLFKLAIRYGSPYFQNFISSDIRPEDIRSMCCRLRLDKRELRRKAGSIFGSDELTGSVGVVTVNLAQAGYLSCDEDDFFRRLDYLLDLSRDSLVIKRKVINKLMETGLYPYSKHYLGSLDNHFNTIGVCGMNECLLNLLKKDILSKEGHDFAFKVLSHIRERIASYQEESGELFNLEATPAESACYRFALHDKENFTDILTSGKNRYFYTNSTQIPSDYDIDVFDALDNQDDLQAMYTGGTVFHAFIGEELSASSTSDVGSLKNLIRTIFTGYQIPSLTVSPTYSICPKHGYIPGKHFECPKCLDEKKADLKEKIASLEAQREALLKKRGEKSDRTES